MRAKLRALLLGAVFSAAGIVSVQSASGVKRILEYDPAPFDAGTIYHYSLTLNPKKPAIDYWLYLSDGGIARTLYDSTRIDGSGLLHDTWKLDPEGFRILERRTENLAPSLERVFASRAYQYDWDARKLRSAYIFPDGEKEVPPIEELQYEPEIKQHDLGIYFSLFFRYAKPGPGVFTLLYDSYGHPIFMEARYSGEDWVNGIPCLKYAVRGKGLWSSLIGQGGYVWTAKEDQRHFIVKQTMRIGFSWTMRDFSLELVDERPADDAAWEKLKTKAIDEMD